MINLTEQELDLIFHIKKKKLKEYWCKYTGNSVELWFDGMLYHFFLPKVLPIIHKWLGDERFYDRIVESTRISYPIEAYWVGQIDLIPNSDIFEEIKLIQ